MTERPHTPLLDSVPTPTEWRALRPEQLRQLADELRDEMVSAVSVTGGHLGAGLGVVELTVAVHYVFETPRDRLIWDVGPQAYPHHILTGRRARTPPRRPRRARLRCARAHQPPPHRPLAGLRDRLRPRRQGRGLSGFPKRSESEYAPL